MKGIDEHFNDAHAFLLFAGFSDLLKKSSDPAWRQTFFLYIQNKETHQLEILVEAVTEDDAEENIVIGRASVDDLESLCDGNIHNLSLKLERSVL